MNTMAHTPVDYTTAILPKMVDMIARGYGHEADIIAWNPKTPARTLRAIFEAQQNGTIEFTALLPSLAENENTPADVLEQLAQVGDSDVINQLVQNTNTPNSVIVELMNNLAYA